jgi:hypothetical protein
MCFIGKTKLPEHVVATAGYHACDVVLVAMHVYVNVPPCRDPVLHP